MQSHPKQRNHCIILSRTLFVIGIFAQVVFIALLFRSYGGLESSSGATTLAQAADVGDANFKVLNLRHVLHHGAGQSGPRAIRLDITPERVATSLDGNQLAPVQIRTSPLEIERPQIWSYGEQIPMSPLWTAEDVLGPDVEDKETVITFANMSENAYKVGRDDPGWMDVDKHYKTTVPFGWDDSGIRGHVFGDDDNSTVILAVKGTTVAMFEGNGTSGHDKDNDNLFGSCCCGQGGTYLWRQVCDCKTGTYSCDDKCVRHELRKPNMYYAATVELYKEVIKLYPHANIITTGHSLGGVLASLIGLQHGIPSVTFEAYPQAMAAKRLGLPAAGDVAPLRRNTGGFHFGHTADPVYMGTCNGATSFCSIGGYAFETLCHTGKRCAYDVVKDWGWRPSTQTHSLRYAIDNVYVKYEKAATCEDEDVDCVDCVLWKFENGTKLQPTTTSSIPSSTTTRTRTETCKTPGWWGCRDETTSTAPPSTTSSSSPISTSTSTCQTPGWFGCKDKTSLASSTTSTTTEQTTTTCTSKGWFGRCRDDVPATTSSAVEGNAYWRTEPTATRTAM